MVLGKSFEAALPAPISSSVRGVATGRPYKRLLLTLGTLALVYGAYYGTYYVYPHYRSNNTRPVIEYPTKSSTANPHALPIYWGEQLMPTHPLPDPFGNPWPERPEITNIYFHPERAVIDPPIVPFPDYDQILQIQNSSSTLSKIPFESITPPKGWSAQDSPGKLGDRQDLNKVQWSGFDKGKVPDKQEKLNLQRREWVRRAMRHGWEGYKEYAWGHDEIKPLSNNSQDTFGGWGASIIDALDTLLLFDMHRDYDIARAFVRSVDFTHGAGATMGYGAGNGEISVFETTIRYLGGLISAYDLSQDQLMLDRAIDLAEWLMGAFTTSSGLPLGRYRFGYDHEGRGSGRSVLSEVGSMCLEFTRLYQITGRSDFYEIIQRVTDKLDTGFEGKNRLGRLLPQFINAESPQSLSGTYSAGALADSYYEYLVKQDQLIGRATPQYQRMYSEAMDSLHEYLVTKVSPFYGEELTIIGTNGYSHSAVPTLEHLTCFAGAMLGLGSRTMSRNKDLETAQEFTRSCFWTYNATKSGVAPEWTTFYKPNEQSRFSEMKIDDKTYLKPVGSPTGVKRSDNRYLGRPETIESIFYMYRITGDPYWQDIGWQMFTSWVNASATSVGYANIRDVNSNPPNLEDSMESFVLAETLKYYFLLFSPPNTVSLDEYVLNTEAHPFKIPTSSHEPLWKGPNKELERKYSLEKFFNPETNSVEHLPVGRGTALQMWHRLGLSPPVPSKNQNLKA